jgi:hypothetical protein
LSLWSDGGVVALPTFVSSFLNKLLVESIDQDLDFNLLKDLNLDRMELLDLELSNLQLNIMVPTHLPLELF